MDLVFEVAGGNLDVNLMIQKLGFFTFHFKSTNMIFTPKNIT